MDDKNLRYKANQGEKKKGSGLATFLLILASVLMAVVTVVIVSI